ncbi:unnamed protein product, partial [Ectocarpus sp. 13 AM-2016]
SEIVGIFAVKLSWVVRKRPRETSIASRSRENPVLDGCMFFFF